MKPRAANSGSGEPVNPELREYQGSDLGRLVELDRLCFPPDIAYSQAEFEDFLRRPGVFCLLAEVAGQVDAFIMVEEDGEQRTGHLLTVDVEPSVQRQHLGATLLQAAEQRLRELGAQRLLLEVAEDNGPARAFYDRSGFVSTGRIPDYYPKGRAAIIMEKPL